jgi:putative spermidine/putrescine transport system substrate-binding protein
MPACSRPRSPWAATRPISSRLSISSPSSRSRSACSPIGASPANLEKGEIEVGVLWDFNALNYRDKVGRDKFEVVIPSDGSVTSGYTTIINAYAKNVNAAKLTREYIFSDPGQINLAKGYARPIRVDKIKMPAEVAERLLPAEQYAKARPIDAANWSQNARRLPQLWQAKVLSAM